MNIATKIIDPSRCTGCMICRDLCHVNFTCASDGKAEVVAESPLCFACGHCVAACPAEAISMPDFPDSAFERIDRALTPSFESLLHLMKARRSRREYLDKPVPVELIDKLLDAAVHAPDACNQQTVGYMVVTDPDVLKSIRSLVAEMFAGLMKMLGNPFGRRFFRTFYRRAYDELAEFIPLFRMMADVYEQGMDPITWGAPCLIIVHTPRNDSCGPENAIYSAANILLASETLGLGTCVLGVITDPLKKNRQLRRLVGLPDDRVPQTSMVVGYPKFNYARTAAKNAPNVKTI